MVMEYEKIFTKINLHQKAQNKCMMVKRNIESFMKKYENLVKMGLHSSWNDKVKLPSFEGYKNNLFIVREGEEKVQGGICY
jgi:hypothetical protein